MAKIGSTRMHKVGGSNTIIVPAAIFADEAFPFKQNEKDLVIEIRGKELVVKRYGH